MTTDNFTEAARAEAEDYARTPRMNVGTVRDRITEAHQAGAEWARTHLAQQEPTDAEVLADTDRSVERAVRELHAPRCHGMRGREGKPVDSCDHCYGPDGYNATYPCATIQALDAAIRLDRDFRDGVVWARTHLAAQEPNDAEVEAAARTWAESGPTTAVWEQMTEERREYTRERMRACLSAARAARRDEETR